MRLQAYYHAMREYPRESCGLVVQYNGRPRYWPCENLSNAVQCFMLNPVDFGLACDAGEILAVVHSHPDQSPNPSATDRQSCQASGYPWHIVSVPGNSWAYIEPEGHTSPLIGREWVHATSDCYTLIRDWYRVNHAIYLADYDRRDEWWKHGDDLYLQNFASEGFMEIPLRDIRPGDALLMRVGSRVPNHAAVYLGDNVILHHVQGRLSGRDLFDDAWQRRVTHVLRYADDLSAW